MWLLGRLLELGAQPSSSGARRTQEEFPSDGPKPWWMFAAHKSKPERKAKPCYRRVVALTTQQLLHPETLLRA